MCVSYSGKYLSNYTAGRDSNRGGCVQSCRHHYKLLDNENTNGLLMNAKDLMGAALIPALMDGHYY